MLRLLKNNRPSGLAFIVFLLILLFLKTALDPVPGNTLQGMPLYELLPGKIAGLPIPAAAVSTLIFVLLLLLIIRLNIIHFLLEDRTYMPATFFLLINASWPVALQLNPILFSTPFLLLAILTLIRGEEHRADPMALFNATLLLAAGSLFYLKLIWFIPFFWITAAIIRPLKWRGIINPLIAMILLGGFLFTWYWVIKDDLPLLGKVLRENLGMGNGRLPTPQLPGKIILAFLALLITISSFHLLSRYQFRKIIIRKLYLVLFILFCYGLLFFFLVTNFREEVMIIVAVPLTYLFSNYFYRKKNSALQEVLIWVWLILIVYVQIAPITGWQPLR